MRINHASSRRLIALGALLVAISGCQGSTSPWNGNWKLDTAKSRVQHAYYFTITTSPDGGIQQKNESFTADFRCDGRDYSSPLGKDLTTSCIQASPIRWRLTYKWNGTISSEVLWDLSPDSTTLTIHGKTKQPDGSYRTSEQVYHRRGEGKGFSGEWQPVNPFESHPKILSVALEGARVRLVYPELGEYVDAPLDGTPALVHSRAPYERQGSTMSIRQVGPLQMYTESSFEGRVISEGTMKLSDDGHTILQEFWVPGKPNEINSYVYEKQ